MLSVIDKRPRLFNNAVPTTEMKLNVSTHIDVYFIITGRMAVVSHSNPASAVISRCSCGAQGSDKRNALYKRTITNISRGVSSKMLRTALESTQTAVQ
jgi:hypothetical protein